MDVFVCQIFVFFSDYVSSFNSKRVAVLCINSNCNFKIIKIQRYKKKEYLLSNK